MSYTVISLKLSIITLFSHNTKNLFLLVIIKTEKSLVYFVHFVNSPFDFYTKDSNIYGSKSLLSY